MAAPRRPPAPAPSPSRATAYRQIVFGTVIALLGAGGLAVGLWTMGAPLLLFGGLIGSLGVLLLVSSDAVTVVNTSHNLLLQGRMAEVERLLDQAEGRRQLGYIRRVIDLQRATIAIRRGDLEGALARAEAAYARKPRLLTRGQERLHRIGAQSMRALIRASLGDVEGARADAAAVRVLPDAPAEALARAEVAEAVALSRSGDREALGAHLASRRRLLLDHTVPRERAVVRAFQRMLTAPRTSVYRKIAARDETEGGEPTVADWIARIAPAAAPFARASRAHSEGAAPPGPASEAPVEPGLVRVAEERLTKRALKQRARSGGKVLALWILLVVLFVAIWQLLEITPEASGPAVARTLGDLVPGATSVLAIAFLAAIVALVTRNLRHDKRLARALGALARDDAGAPAELEALSRSPYTLVAAQAQLQLGRLAEQKGDLEEALRRCDEGIAAATMRGSTRALASSILLPDLCAERAFVLAASDRADKSRAEMEALRKQFPAYPYLARAELREALVRHARRGDLDSAAHALAGAGDDLPLWHRDETLADLVRVLRHPGGAAAGEVERLKGELRTDPDLRAWLSTVAPSVLRRFEAPPPAEAEADPDAEAEREALAEEEAKGQMERRL